MPKVSVILPVYNEEKWVSSAINSILNQTLADFEFLIINDGSQDNTEEVVRSFSDSRIKLINNEKNLGLAQALNKGLFMALSSYIARIDADDLALPTRLEKQVKFLEENPEVAVLGTAAYHNDEIRKEKFIRIPPTDDHEIKSEMVKYVPLEHSSIMARTSVLKEMGGYDDHYDDIEDLELWIRIGRENKLANLSEPLIIRNLRPDSFWFSNYSAVARQLKFSRVAKKAISAFNLPKWYYFYTLTKVFYGIVPNSFKRLARKIASKSIETPVRELPRLGQCRRVRPPVRQNIG
ncbi:MAG: glycosyltransferase family 2 protein [bacterium]